MAALHPLVLRTVEAYLAAVDHAAPGLVEALYLVGSIALGDFQPGWSDLDFVAVTGGRPTEAALAALARAHWRLAGEGSLLTLDGLYLTWDEVRAGPFATPDGPCVLAGRFCMSRRHGRHPLTWGVLAADAVTVRGPMSAGASVWMDQPGLERSVLRDLDEHWLPWFSRASRLLSRDGLSLLRPGTVSRTVLDVCRYHYVLATGVVPSRSDAGLYGLITFPAEWRGIFDEALRIRRSPRTRSHYREPFTRRRHALALIRMVAEDARDIGGAVPAG
ncbi:nucleotidyltransferase domain-containing protein [Methylobacterium sp. JK268]